MQNSGVTVDADSDHFCSASDNNPIRASMPYFGVIHEIWELDYTEFRVVVFKCKWVNANTGVRKDDFGFTLVDLNKVGYIDEPFIMAQQARQVFYVQDPCDSRYSVVLQGRPSGLNDTHDGCTLDIYLFPQKFLLPMTQYTLMRYKQIIMIMMKDYGKTMSVNCTLGY